MLGSGEFSTVMDPVRADGSYGRVVSRFILQALKGEDLTVFGDGSQTRSFCYVTDTVSGIPLQTGREDLNGEVFNVGSKEEKKIIELAEKTIQLSSTRSKVKFLPFPAGDHRRRLPEMGKAGKIMGWHPRVDLKQGMARTVEWFRERHPS
jgi:UDP-glucuronate decarboxylase